MLKHLFGFSDSAIIVALKLPVRSSMHMLRIW